MTSILARSVEVTDEDIVVNLMTGDPIQIPIRWFPSQQRADRVAREGCVLRDEGLPVVWPDVPESGSHDAPAEGLSVPHLVSAARAVAENPLRWVGDDDVVFRDD